jgi:hypothetical protein
MITNDFNLVYTNNSEVKATRFGDGFRMMMMDDGFCVRRFEG